MTEQRSRILRHWPWRLLLLLALIPLAFAAVPLARLPMSSTGDISDDGEYVLTGRYREYGKAADFEVVSLRTGQSAVLCSENVPRRSAQTLLWTERDSAGWVVAKQLDLTTFRETELGRIAGDELSDRFAMQAPGVFAFVNERNELVVIDLKNQHRTSVPLPPLAAPSRHYLMPMPEVGSPTRLIVTEDSSGATSSQTLLFSYENGELGKLAEWPADSHQRHVTGDSVLSVTAQSVLEIRRLSDGSLIDSQPLGKKLNVPPGTGIELDEPKDGLIPLRVTPSRKIIYDYVGKRIVLERFLPNLRNMDLCQDAALYIDKQSVEVVRLADPQTVQRFDFPRYVEVAKFAEDGQQLTVLLADESIYRYDLATGKLLGTWRNRAWVIPTVVALLVGFAVWSWLWVWLGLRSGWHPLADLVVLHGLLLIGVLLPVPWLGGLLNSSIVSFFDFETLAACWLLLLSLWFIFGRARWSLRLLGPILGVAAAIGLNFVALGGNSAAITITAVGVASVAVLFTALFGLARRWGFRLVNERQTNPLPAVSERARQMPLRDSFCLMATFAIFFAVVRFVPLVRFDYRSMNTLIVIVASLSATALGGTWTALGSRSWLLGFACLLVLVGGICVFHPQFFQLGPSWKDWLSSARLYSPLAIFVFGSLLIFRVRGWRLVWR